MNRNTLIEQLKHYEPFNEQEEMDCQILLQLLEKEEDIYERSNRINHLSASAWVVNHDRTHVLMAYHNIYQSFSWLGGHADGEEDLLGVAVREVQEESGVEHIKVVSDEIYSVETLPVSGHEKKGKYVPSHLHVNVTYLLEVDEKDPLHVKADENSDVRWLPIETLESYISEPWMYERIYRKLIAKLKK